MVRARRAPRARGARPAASDATAARGRPSACRLMAHQAHLSVSSHTSPYFLHVFTARASSSTRSTASRSELVHLVLRKDESAHAAQQREQSAPTHGLVAGIGEQALELSLRALGALAARNRCGETRVSGCVRQCAHTPDSPATCGGGPHTKILILSALAGACEAHQHATLAGPSAAVCGTLALTGRYLLSTSGVT